MILDITPFRYLVLVSFLVSFNLLFVRFNKRKYIVPLKPALEMTKVNKFKRLNDQFLIFLFIIICIRNVASRIIEYFPIFS